MKLHLFSLALISSLLLLFVSLLFPTPKYNEQPLIVLVIADTHHGGVEGYIPLGKETTDIYGRTQGQRCLDLVGNLSFWSFDAFVVLGDWLDDARDPTELSCFLRDFYMPYSRGYEQPLFLVQGNHEVETLDAYSWWHPTGFYSVNMRGIHLCFLGWGAGGWRRPTFSQANMTWIHNDLTNTNSSTIVFLHAPMITDDKVWNGNQNPLNVTQAEILCGYPNVLGFASGHTHEHGLGLITDYFDFSTNHPMFTYNPYAISTAHLRCQSNMSMIELGIISVYTNRVIIDCLDADSKTVIWTQTFMMDTTLED